jgi:hypothetical protein
MPRDYEFENARPEHVARQVWLLRWRFTVWLFALPITIPLVAMAIVFKCWVTIDAIIRLFHHQY